LEEELANPDDFAPFVCAGQNGNGKSNVLEVLAIIFYQLEVLRVRRNFLPPNFIYDEDENPDGLKESEYSPNAFELEYLIKVPKDYCKEPSQNWARVTVWKDPDTSVKLLWENQQHFNVDVMKEFSGGFLDILLPDHVLAYSSGGNETLSLPFFKMRFLQFDEYIKFLNAGGAYDKPDTRLTYLDSSFSQAILISNWLFNNDESLKPFTDIVGLQALKEFRIVLKSSVEFNPNNHQQYQKNAVSQPDGISEHNSYFLPILRPLETNHDTIKENGHSSALIEKFKRCATCYFLDEDRNELILDYCVNTATKKAFQDNFMDAIELFQAFQILLTLNLYTVSDKLKTEVYASKSQYVNETIPVLASDERVMRFKFVKFSKLGVDEAVMLRNLSDGEHQFLHSLGLCLLFKNTNSLFLLDEPETHFNPNWRASFISQLKACLGNTEKTPEMLITTHSPFLISDSKSNKVLEFEKDPETRHVKITHPDYNTFGASINKITMKTFNKRETIGGSAQSLMDTLRIRFEQGEEPTALIDTLNRELGDSVEKILLIKAMLDRTQEKGEEVQR
jgi:restriction system-associated AAA family ATPase